MVLKHQNLSVLEKTPEACRAELATAAAHLMLCLRRRLPRGGGSVPKLYLSYGKGELAKHSNDRIPENGLNGEK